MPRSHGAHREFGTVTRLGPNGRFGFVRREHFGDIFVHINDLTFSPRYLYVGQRLSFTVHDELRGPKAVDVTAASSHPPYRSTSSPVVRGEPPGPGFNTELFQEPVPEELVCSICLGVLNHPMQTKCEHLFCQDCILRWIKVRSVCPVDRGSVNEKDLRPAPAYLRSLVGRLILSCKFSARGCKELVSLDNLEKHNLACPFRPSLSPGPSSHASRRNGAPTISFQIPAMPVRFRTFSRDARRVGHVVQIINFPHNVRSKR